MTARSLLQALIALGWSAVAALSWADAQNPTRSIQPDQQVEGVFETPQDSREVFHRFELPKDQAQAPWRLVVTQQGLEVRVVTLNNGARVESLNFHLDRFEREVFRLGPEVTAFEIHPVSGADQSGSYRLLLELPVAEQESRRELETRLTEAARVEHGSESSAVRKAAALYESIASDLVGTGPLTTRARALLGAANHRRTVGESERAKALYAEAASIWRQLDDSAWLAASLLGEGQSLRRMGDLKTARAILEQALDLWRTLADREAEVALTESNLGLVSQIDGDLPRALVHYQQALESHRILGQEREVANVSLNMGSALARLGNAPKALAHQQQSLDIFRRLKDRRGELDALNSLASLHRRMADFESALRLFGESRQLAQEIGDGRLEGRALSNRGWVYLGLGQYERAIADLEIADRMSAESGDFNVHIATLVNLADAHERVGRFQAARRYLLDALERAKARDHRRQMIILARLGRNKARQGRGDGEEELAAAWALAEKRGDAWDKAALHAIHAEARSVRGEAGQALESYRSAQQAWRFIGNEAGVILATIGRGRTEKALGHSEAARESLESAVASIESFRVEIANPNLRATFLANQLDAYEQLVEVLIDLHGDRPDPSYLARALEVSEHSRGRQLFDLAHKPRRAVTSAQDSRLLTQRRELAQSLALLARRYELVALGRQRPAPEVDLAAAINETRARIDVIDASLQLEPRQSKVAAATNFSLEIVRSNLEQRVVVLFYSLGPKRSHVWSLDARGLKHAELPERARVEAAARRAHHAFSTLGDSPRENREAASELSNMILGPVESKLQGDRLLIVPDGALHYVPFAALPLPGSETNPSPLIETFEISRLASLATLTDSPTAPSLGLGPSTKLAILADPVFDAGDPRLSPSGRPETVIAQVRGAPNELVADVNLGRLPGSAEEAVAIAAYASAENRRVSLGFEANREALIEDLADSSIIHLATHGLINTTYPELSGLMLSRFHADGRRRSDGFFRVFDLHDLELRAELVVLSGCRTALGQELGGEALQGLVSNFRIAGAERVMASLWAVADRATSRLMDSFYSALLRQQASPANALRQAQIDMAKSRQHADPYYWAPFMIQGAPDLRMPNPESPSTLNRYKNQESDSP